MKVTDAFKGNFIEALHLTEKDANLVITGYDKPNTVKSADKTLIDKPILRFEGTDQGMILNKTNARTIGLTFGNEMDGWKGKKITLFATTCEAFGKTVPCVRVRPMSIYQTAK
jgi:hypothetical protein